MSSMTFFLQASLALFLTFLVVLLLNQLQRFLNFSFQDTLKVNRILFVLSFLVPILNIFIEQRPWPSVVQIYSGSTSEHLPLWSQFFPHIETASIQATKTREWVRLEKELLSLVLGLFVVGILLGVFRSIKCFQHIRRIKKSSVLIHQTGKIKVYFQYQVRNAFAILLPQGSSIFLPLEQKINPRNSRWILRHELQHVRQGDLLWQWVYQVPKIIFWFHPLVHLWIRQLESLQEFACDEAIVRESPERFQKYGQAMVDLATLLPEKTKIPIGAPGLFAISHLKRRILFMKTNSRMKMKKISALAMFSLVGAITLASWAGSQVIEDCSLTMERVKVLAQKNLSENSIPVVVTKEVVFWLSRATSTARARLYLRNSLRRMQGYQASLSKLLSQNQMPMDLLAVPLLESGYQNYEGRISGGIWQFTPDTARAFGLRVDDEVDERMDAEKLTGAAIQYYQKLMSEFNNWSSALLAYNLGEMNLRRAFQDLGTTDPWKVIQSETIKEESRKYLPQMMASIIIFRNPDLVKE